MALRLSRVASGFLVITIILAMCAAHVSYAAEQLRFKKGEFVKLSSLPAGKDLNIAKKNGTFDERNNDLMELCKDWLYYRNKIMKAARSGDQAATTKARTTFNEINASLSEYHEQDVQHMFALLEKSGYKAP